MGTSFKQRDYLHYRFDKREGFKACILAMVCVLLAAFFFYRSLWAVLPLLPLGHWIVRYLQRQKGEQIRWNLAEQFKECILAVSASMQAGYAVENAFLDCREDMRRLYGEKAAIVEEMDRIRRGLMVNISLEQLLLDLGQRSGNEEILQFAQLFSVAKRSGGNLPEMIRTSANLIGQKMDARYEIQVMLSGRKMEQNIMRLMPFGILLYVGSTSPGYFHPLYHNYAGVVVMTVCFGFYILAFWIGEKVFQGIWKQLDGVLGEIKLPGLPRTGVFARLADIGDRIFLAFQRRVPDFYGKEAVKKRLEFLCQEDDQEEILLQYYGGKIALSLFIFGVGSFLAISLQLKKVMGVSEENVSFVIWIMSIMAAGMIFILLDKDLQDQVNRKKKWMQIGYPDFVHRLALYLVAGMTIRGAFQKMADQYQLARIACREMNAGQSEMAAYESFGKRAGIREYVKLSTLLCQNLKKGTGTLLNRLEEEAVATAEQRVQNGKKLGEEAETKLLIPMVLLLAVVMTMIMIPAFSVMGV